eukprot:gene34201-41401_t
MGHLGFEPTADSNAKTVTMQKGSTSILVRVVAFSPEEVMIYVKRDQEKVLGVKLLTTMSSSAYKSLIKRFLILPCCTDQSLAAPALSYIPEEFVLNISMYLPIKDLLRTFATNKKMHQLFMRETFPWSELIRRDLHGANMQVSDNSTDREKYKILYKKATLSKKLRSRCPYIYTPPILRIHPNIHLRTQSHLLTHFSLHMFTCSPSAPHIRHPILFPFILCTIHITQMSIHTPILLILPTIPKTPPITTSITTALLHVLVLVLALLGHAVPWITFLSSSMML